MPYVPYTSKGTSTRKTGHFIVGSYPHPATKRGDKYTEKGTSTRKKGHCTRKKGHLRLQPYDSQKEKSLKTRKTSKKTGALCISPRWRTGRRRLLGGYAPRRLKPAPSARARPASPARAARVPSSALRAPGTRWRVPSACAASQRQRRRTGRGALRAVSNRMVIAETAAAIATVWRSLWRFGRLRRVDAKRQGG